MFPLSWLFTRQCGYVRYCLIFYLQLDVTCIFSNNEIYEKLLEKLVFHDKLKHIEIKFHYIKDMVHRGVMNLQCIETDEQTTDVFTKLLARVKY